MSNQSTYAFDNIDDYIDTTAIFAGVNKNIFTKDFRGGEIVNVFGETKLNFTNADMAGVAVLDITQGFGEVKIAVPDDWFIESRTSHIFSTIQDKRTNAGESYNSKKILVLRGVSFFGQVTILNKR